MKLTRLVYVVTHPVTASNLMRGQLRYMRSQGLDVFVISSPAQELQVVQKQESVGTIAISMSREINVFKDLISLTQIFRALRKLKPDIVNASTPKAGFLGMIAAWMARVPVRIYTLRGLRLETTKGALRYVLQFTERIASACAHRIICVSESLRKQYTSLGLAEGSKTIVLANGSSNGIDTNRFPFPVPSDRKDALRQNIGIPRDAQVIGFLGRLTHDKGISEILIAFQELIPSFPKLHLLVVGGFEDGDAVDPECIRIINQHAQIIRKGFHNDPVPFYTVMDVLVFPSHREGFPNTPLEAASLGIPTVGFRVTGTVDAIEDGVTGRLVDIGNVKALAEAITLYLQNDQLRKKHGEAARDRVLRMYGQERVWNQLFTEYTSLLQKREEIKSNN